MTVRGVVLRVVLGTICLVSLGLAAGHVFSTPGSTVVTPMVVTDLPLPGSAEGRPDPAQLARRIRARNPFRVHRSPSAVRYSAAEPEGAAPRPAPARQLPALLLSGVVLGDEVVALIDGLPGTDGTRALRVGESAAGWRVLLVTFDRAVLAGMDTTLTLPLRTRFP